MIQAGAAENPKTSESWEKKDFGSKSFHSPHASDPE